MENSGRFLLGLALAAGLVISTVVATRTAVHLKTDNTISVTGSAKRRLHSDHANWTCEISARATDLRSAYRALAASAPKVSAFLDKRGLAKEYKRESVSTKVQHPRDKEGREIDSQISGYVLTQRFEIRSDDVDKVEAAAQAVTDLIDEGVEVESYAPDYVYRKLPDLKIQMLAEAAKDARVRAVEIARAGGAKVGVLRATRMGVIQVNAADSTETSNEGNNDTSSIDKDILTVVSSTFALE